MDKTAGPSPRLTATITPARSPNLQPIDTVTTDENAARLESLIRSVDAGTLRRILVSALSGHVAQLHPPISESTTPTSTRPPTAKLHSSNGGTHPESPLVQALRTRYPAIDPALFVMIQKNRFRPDHIFKLSTSFRPQRPDYREGLSCLMQPLNLYTQILVHFAAADVQLELAAALADYMDHLFELNHTHTFESVKEFHLTFHQKRIVVGVWDPAGWREKDQQMEFLNLVKRKAPAELWWESQ
jgi:hypothetical protein